ncbi:MAG: GLPGLI family protein [Bacteroidetes bacterium]|nr:MAG: GLPGLI family protein [Bacteroidota bacterium]
MKSSTRYLISILSAVLFYKTTPAQQKFLYEFTRSYKTATPYKEKYVLLHTPKTSIFYSLDLLTLDSINQANNVLSDKDYNDEIIEHNGETIHVYGVVLISRYQYQDTVNNIEWKLYTDSTKRIQGFKCTKATANFRGKIWEVWFTADIPIGLGPWKLQGLPGLIVEAKTADGKLAYSLLGTKLSSSLAPSLVSISKRSKNISKSEFLFLKNDFYKNMNKYYMAEPSYSNIGVDFSKPMSMPKPPYFFEE